MGRLGCCFSVGLVATCALVIAVSVVGNHGPLLPWTRLLWSATPFTSGTHQHSPLVASVTGWVAPGYERVRDVLVAQASAGFEDAASVSAFVEGEEVVHLIVTSPFAAPATKSFNSSSPSEGDCPMHRGEPTVRVTLVHFGSSTYKHLNRLGPTFRGCDV